MKKYSMKEIKSQEKNAIHHPIEIGCFLAGGFVTGKVETIIKEYDGEVSLKHVYAEMKEKGNWDIIIPRIQEVSDG